MGIKAEDKIWFKEGREAHSIIQKHVSGVEPYPAIAHILDKFPIVEEVDFDPRLKFERDFKNYKIIGFLDGLNEEEKAFLEIKTSSKAWSIGQFQKAMQRKIYAFLRPDLVKSVLITGARNPELWLKDILKIYHVPSTAQDEEEAKEWIEKGIVILEAGNFTSDLVDGKCVERWCNWGKNCSFK